MKKYFYLLPAALLVLSLSCKQSSSDDAEVSVALSGLSLSPGTLTPAFSASVTSYTASVANAVPSVTVTPKVDDSKLSISVDGAAVASGTASPAIALKAGETKSIPVVVSNGSSSATYTVAVARAPAVVLSGLSLSAGTLSPAFSAGVTSYTALVPYSSPSTTVTASTANSAYAVSVDGTALTLAASGDEFSGTSASIGLAVGSNDVSVIASYGGDSTTYAIAVTRDGIPNILVTGPAVYGGAVTTLGSGALIDFNNVAKGTPRDITITIASTGAGSLRLTGTSPNYVVVSGSTVYSIPTQPSESTIPSGQNQTFVIRFTSQASWVDETATVTVLNDDLEDGTFTLSLTGYAMC